ncbi:MAG: autotransporter-associated beta strand repeat-containing protein, partial [Cephaloticoccus sp.]|nr:autotransporter-associated beta strand repeat-containing protein [Cephaloticoccus sp.]
MSGYAPQASAQVTWDGSAADGLWSTAANWDTGLLPTGSDTVQFDADDFAAGTTSISLDGSNRDVDGVVFNAATIVGDFQFTTNQVRIGAGGLVNNDDQTQRFSNIYLNSNQTWSLTGDLRIDNVLTHRRDLTINGSGVLDIRGRLQLAGSRTLTYNSSGGALIDDVRLNGPRLTLAGTGDIDIQNTLTNFGGDREFENNSTGTVTINNIDLSNDATDRVLAMSGTGTTTVSGVVANGSSSTAGNLVKTGSGNLILAGANTYGGTTTISAGTVTLQNSSALGETTGGTSVALGATLALTNGIDIGGEAIASDGAVVSTSGTNSYAGSLSGSGTLSVTTGQLTVSGDNSHTGATTINGGTLIATHGNALGTTAAGTTVSSGATLEIQGGATISGESLTVTGTGRLRNTTDSNTYGGVVSGTGVVTVDGGSLTLTGNNSYSGATTVNGGTLVAANDNALGTNAAGTTVATGATLELQGGVTIADEALGVTGTGRLYNATGTNVYGGAISGTGGVTVDGGELTLTGSSNYSGATTINNGTLSLGGTGVLDAATDVTIGALGTLNLAGYSQRIDNLTADDGATIDFGSSPGANDFVFDNYTAPSSGVLVISNWEEGVDRLASTNGSTDASTIYLSGFGVGEIDSGTTFILGTNAYLITAVGVVAKEWDGSSSDSWSSAFNWTSFFAPNSSQVALFDDLGTSRPDVNLNTTTTIAGIEFGENATVDYTISSATNDITLSGAVPFIQHKNSNTQTIAIDQLILYNNTVADITGTGDLVISADITDGGGGHSLTRDGGGAGILVLSGNNTYSGGLYINGGIVEAQSSGALGTGTAVIASGGTLELNGSGTIDESINLAGTGVGGNGAIRNTAGSNTLSGTLTESGSTRFVADGGTTLNLTGNLTGSDTNTTFVGAGTINVSQITTGGGTVTIESGAVTFNGGSANTFTGVTTVDGGTLTLNKSAGVDAIGTGGLVINAGTSVILQQNNQINDAATVTLNGTGTLSLNDQSETIAQLNSASATATVALGTGTLTVGTVGMVDSNFDGAITGAGASSLVVDGEGTVFLTGNNTGYAGTTTVAAGTLNLSGSNNAAGTGGVTVASGGTLQVEGGLTLANALTLNGSGVSGNGALENVSGSNTIAGNLNLDSGSVISVGSGDLEINGTISGSGALTKSGTNTLTLSGTNDYTGATIVSDGTLAISADANLGATPGSPVADQLTLDGGTLRTTTDLVLATNRGITLSGAGGTLNVDGGTTATYGGVVAGSGDFTKSGSGNLVLNGANTANGILTMDGGTLELNAAQSFDGNLQINAGTVVVGDDDAFGTGAIRLYAATLEGDGSTRTIANTLRVQDDSATIAGSSDLVFSGDMIAHGNRTLNITNTGTTTFNNLDLSNNNNNRTFTLNNTGNVVVGGTVANGGTSTSALTKTGSGQLTLSGTNTYSGATTISAGTLLAQSNGALG